MDELIKLVGDKTGLAPDKAQMVVELVVNHIKGKAPALSGQLDSLLAGGTGGAGDLMAGLGGLLGGKK